MVSKAHLALAQKMGYNPNLWTFKELKGIHAAKVAAEKEREEKATKKLLKVLPGVFEKPLNRQERKAQRQIDEWNHLANFFNEDHAKRNALAAGRIPQGIYIVTAQVRLQHKEQEKAFTRTATNDRVVVHEETPFKAVVESMVDEWISQHYHHSQIKRVGISGEEIRPRVDADIRRIPLKRAQAMQYKLFPADLEINRNEGQCFLDYATWALCQKLPKYTRVKLITELKEVIRIQSETDQSWNDEAHFETEGVTLRHIMAWARSKNYITCIALNMHLQCIESVTARDHTTVVLTFIVNDEHCFPITDKTQQDEICRTKRLNLSSQTLKVGNEASVYLTLLQASALLSQENPEVTEKIIHVETDDLSQLVCEVTQATGYRPMAMQAHHSFITHFEHPLTKQLYIASPDYLLRKELCELLFKETNYIQFRWQNQSWAQIGNAWFEAQLGDFLPVEHYGPDSMRIREMYPTGAFIGRTRDVSEEEAKHVVSFDICKCYPSTLMANKFDYAVESAFDNVEEWSGADGGNDSLPVGKAYTETTFYLGKARYSRGFYPSFFLQYAIEQGALSHESIKYVQRAAKVLKADTFAEPTRKLLEMSQLGKRAINPAVGSWGQRFLQRNQVALTDSWEMATAMLCENENVRLSEVGSLWFLRKEEQEEMLHGHISLREHIVCLGHIQLHEMEKQVCDVDTEVIAYNTDSIKVINPAAAFKPVPKELAKPGDICLEGKCNLRGKIISEFTDRPHFQLNRYWKDLNRDELVMDRKSCLITAAPGAGKSFLLKQLHDKKTLKMAWTKTAAENIGGETLDHVFSNHCKFQEWVQKAIKYDTLQIDEFTIIPLRWWALFHAIKRAKPSIVFRFYGDPKQLHADEYNRTNEWYLYHESTLMHLLVDGNRLALPYYAEKGRYDADLKARLDHFEQTGTLARFCNEKFFSPAEADFSIVLTPAMREVINNKWVKALSPPDTIAAGTLKLWAGMYLISHCSDSSSGVVNSTRYLVVDPNLIELEHCETKKRFQVSSAVIAKTMRYGYADTVMRVISRTITGRFNIYEADKMSWNQLFVAMSRARTFDDFRLGKQMNADKKYELEKPVLGKEIKLAGKLLNGVIYERSDGEKKYRGSTVDEENRERQHKEEPVSKKVAAWMEGNDRIKMTVLERYKCLSQKQLVNREFELIAELDPETCMNTHGLAKEKVETKIEKIEIQCDRFKITDNAKHHRFEIQWRESGEKKIHRESYRYGPKEDAQKRIEAFRASLVKRLFI